MAAVGAGNTETTVEAFSPLRSPAPRSDAVLPRAISLPSPEGQQSRIEAFSSLLSASLPATQAAGPVWVAREWATADTAGALERRSVALACLMFTRVTQTRDMGAGAMYAQLSELSAAGFSRLEARLAERGETLIVVLSLVHQASVVGRHGGAALGEADAAAVGRGDASEAGYTAEDAAGRVLRQPLVRGTLMPQLVGVSLEQHLRQRKIVNELQDRSASGGGAGGVSHSERSRQAPPGAPADEGAAGARGGHEGAPHDTARSGSKKKRKIVPCNIPVASPVTDADKLPEAVAIRVFPEELEDTRRQSLGVPLSVSATRDLSVAATVWALRATTWVVRSLTFVVIAVFMILLSMDPSRSF